MEFIGADNEEMIGNFPAKENDALFPQKKARKTCSVAEWDVVTLQWREVSVLNMGPNRVLAKGVLLLIAQTE